VHTAIKKPVLAFNRNSGFIETLERGELAAFMHSSVKLTGFQIDNKSDLSEQWREW